MKKSIFCLNYLSPCINIISVGTVALLLGACSLSPNYQQPTPPIPKKWKIESDEVKNQITTDILDWNTFIIDENLRQLVKLALNNNRDLRQALLNVEAARAMYQIQYSERLPTLNAQANGTRQRLPAGINGSNDAITQSTYQIGVALSDFEIDLFGRVKSLSEVAMNEYLANEAAAKGVKISLTGEVIQAYLIREGALRRLQLIQDTLKSRKASLVLTTIRYQNGHTSAIEYQDALGLVEQARVELAHSDREFRQAGNALELLVGINDITPYLSNTSYLSPPIVLTDIAPGVPSEVLIHRPDVQASEHRLKARNANIGAARAAFFPRISLTGFFGSSSSELHDLFSAGKNLWSFTPQINLPFFEGGRNSANLALAEARRDIAIANYESTIQKAFREVADALVATQTLQQEESYRLALSKSSKETLRLSEARFKAGIDDQLRYLDAQRNDLINQIAYINTTTQRQQAQVGLFRVLGGSWKNTY